MSFPEDDDGAAALQRSSCSSDQSSTAGTASLADAKQVRNHLEPGSVQAKRACADGSAFKKPGFRKVAGTTAVDLRGKYESSVTRKSFTAQGQKPHVDPALQSGCSVRAPQADF